MSFDGENKVINRVFQSQKGDIGLQTQLELLGIGRKQFRDAYGGFSLPVEGDDSRARYAYLALTVVHLNPNDAGIARPEGSDHSPIWRWLQTKTWYDNPELFAPGVSNWIGAYHSNTCGQLLILLLGLSLAELLRRKRTNWPWICLGAVPILTIVTSTWALVLEGPILLVTLYWAWREKFFPRNPLFVALVLVLFGALLLPAVWEFHDTTGYPGGFWTQHEAHTPLLIFALAWWPVYLPWIALLCIWPRLSPAIKPWP